MISGYVNSKLEAMISLLVYGPQAEAREIEALIDTGFAGDLTLPSATAEELGLENLAAGILVLADGTEVTFVQIAGLVARRILCYAKVGDTLARGQRYGFIRFGSRVDVYLPLSAKPRVTVGDKVSATETILAEL